MTKLLVVEDSQEIRGNLVKQLEKAGFTVVAAEDGKAGLEAAGREVCDAVITDIEMPRMDGIELITHLRATEKYKKTPILVVSALAQAAMVRKGKLAGADAWMVKPVNADNLVRALRGVLASSPA